MLSQDVRFAMRGLLRAPAFTLVAVLSLGLGIGAVAALFSLVNTVVLKPLAYREPGQLIHVREVVPPLEHLYPTAPVNYQHFLFWRENARSFESLAALMATTEVLASDGNAEVVGGALVSADFFRTLGVEPRLGRSFRREEEVRGARPGVIITDGLWRRRFGGSPAIVGETIRLSGYPYAVLGVLPPTFRFPKNGELGPLTRLAERTEVFLPIQDFNQGWGGDYDYIVFGRLLRGATQAQAADELDLLERRIVAEHGAAHGLHVQARPLQDVIASPVRASLTVLLAAVLVLVLIVCVNLANLLLARGSARAREFSLRIALGAGRGRLVVAALAETALLSLAGGALGVAGAWAAVNAFVRVAPVELPRADETQMDWRVAAFAFGLSLLCALLFGLLPALRLAKADPQSVLRGESHTSRGAGAGLRMREWLVGGEVALSTLLLVLAGLLVNSLWHVLRVERGFTSERTLDARVLVPSKYQKTADKAEFFDRALERLRAIPGVRSAAAVNKPPLTGESNVNEVEIDGAKSASLDAAARDAVLVNCRFVSGDYFTTMGIPLLRGRFIEAGDRERNVALVSARLAAKLWPGQNPVGHRLTSGSGIANAEVVGVVGDVHTTQLERDPTMMIYAPFWKAAYQVSHLVVRAAIDPHALEQEVRRAVQSLDSGIPAPKMETMQEIVDESLAQRRFQMDVAAAFGVAALLLAALGIYGVVAYGVSLRRRELGVRMALGARAAQVRAMLLRRGLRPVGAGLAVGMLAALAAGRLVRSLLFGVTPSDGLTLAGVAAALARSDTGMPAARVFRGQDRPCARSARRIIEPERGITGCMPKDAY